MTETQSQPERRLLTRGESLRVPLDPVNTGGGTKFEPQTALEARALLMPRVEESRLAVARMPGDARAPGQLYVEAELLPNYISASDFPGALLTAAGAVSVGSRVATGEYRTQAKTQQRATRRLILSVSDEGFERLVTLVSNAGGEARSDRAAFEEIRKLSDFGLADVEQVVAQPIVGDDDEPILCEAVLHPGSAANGEVQPVSDEVLQRWITWVAMQGGEVNQDYIRAVGGLTFCAVHLLPRAVSAIASFNPLRTLRPMPAIRPRPPVSLRSGSRLVPPASPATTAPSPKVAVFDGGVATIGNGTTGPYFPIVAADLTPEPAQRPELQHGTGVTGAVLYGLIGPGETAPQIPLPTESFRVLPAPPTSEDLNGYWVLDRIKEVVETGDHKIVNLSLGPQVAVEDTSEPTRWTSELDHLAWEYDVLFVVAAGNDGDLPRETGLHRVQVPADMVNGLSIGACTLPEPEVKWARAEYSSMGPGRAGSRIQPLGVQFGGCTSSRLFPVLKEDGDFLEASGTSFSAPVHTHAMADLTTVLPRATPSVLRAFSAHFAERPKTRARQLRDEVGYGRLPLSFLDVLDCGPDELHVLYIDDINRDELAGYVLPMPDAQTQGRVELKVTLAYSSPIEPSQATEYTQASLELLLRPHALRHRYSRPKDMPGKPEHHDLLITSQEAGELKASGWRESQEPVARTLSANSGRPEHELREAGKWETVRHFRMTMDAAQLHRPRLDMSYVARRTGGLDSAPPTVPFAILVSLTDLASSGTLFDQAAAQFAALRAVPRAASRLRVRSSRHGNWG